MMTEIHDGNKGTHIRKGLLQCLGYRRLNDRFCVRQPLLHNSAQTQVPLDEGIELLGVEQARPSRLHRRWWINRDHIELL